MRPTIEAELNGEPVALTLHSNFGSYLQIDHAKPVKVRVTKLKHVGQYGISASGRLSELGRDEGQLEAICFGSTTLRNVPVSVFEVSAGGSQGMLGVQWIKANRVVLNFRTMQVLLQPSAEVLARLDRDLKKVGYVEVPLLQSDQDGRYLLRVSVHGVTMPLVLSTVAETQLDSAFAARSGIRLNTNFAAEFGGPSGATGKEYASKQKVAFRIGSWTSRPASITVLDTYAYMGKDRPSNVGDLRGGQLGATFLLGNKAVVDFGGLRVFLPTH